MKCQIGTCSGIPKHRIGGLWRCMKHYRLYVEEWLSKKENSEA
ncbi:hypothetical protein HUN41_00114 [Streptomyces phage Coruscant]|uniref:Uncharacterized protein n=1 Tax=Streptomyces phage Coruscant TaxID=2739834 RepID=A0A7G4AW46_9CAUD|nr:hypothetical protein PP454_gp181 [Streptomyces phage Coruscant]QMP84236.1 hypothetical protein HUN41_00114 [Streptomyces phage Coruscant]